MVIIHVGMSRYSQAIDESVRLWRTSQRDKNRLSKMLLLDMFGDEAGKLTRRSKSRKQRR